MDSLKTEQANPTIIEFAQSTAWTVPSGVTSVDVYCVGGGGSGAGDFFAANHSGSGGNGGVVTYAQNVAVTPGTSINITVGSGGAGGMNGNGNQGGTSGFGALVTAQGGYGGVDGQPTAQTTVVEEA